MTAPVRVRHSVVGLPPTGPQLAEIDHASVLALTFGHKLHENDPETCSL